MSQVQAAGILFHLLFRVSGRSQSAWVQHQNLFYGVWVQGWGFACTKVPGRPIKIRLPIYHWRGITAGGVVFGIRVDVTRLA
jgi:hypothetical protein